MLAYQDTIITSLENEFQSFFILLRDHTGYPKKQRGKGTNKSGKALHQYMQSVCFYVISRCTLRVIMSSLRGKDIIIGPPPSYSVYDS